MEHALHKRGSDTLKLFSRHPLCLQTRLPCTSSPNIRGTFPISIFDGKGGGEGTPQHHVNHQPNLCFGGRCGQAPAVSSSVVSVTVTCEDTIPSPPSLEGGLTPSQVSGRVKSVAAVFFCLTRYPNLLPQASFLPPRAIKNVEKPNCLTQSRFRARGEGSSLTMRTAVIFLAFVVGAAHGQYVDEETDSIVIEGRWSRCVHTGQIRKPRCCSSIVKCRPCGPLV